MILQTMLARLHASLARGPGLNARPHRSRQRIDLCELAAFHSMPVETALATLLGPPAKALEFPARVPAFRAPEGPSDGWTDEQKRAAQRVERQSRLLLKLRDIATDATDYFNDHGEDALFLGFPLLSLPASGDTTDAFRQKALLAPLMLAPLTLRVRPGPRAGVTLEPRGDGVDLLLPNPALLAWLEQQTGTNTDDLFADEAGDEPWRELNDLLKLVAQAVDLPAAAAFSAATPLAPVPRADELPDGPILLPSAVLGLFPLTNPGLLRDTKWMMEHTAALRAPVRSFVSPAALQSPASAPAPDAADVEPALAAIVPAGEHYLVTLADPCQAGAVAHARHSEALVIHGPPGTGKSQTIANIIGDHLARGERVLFVCDKRTALDVVKYRLDGMGIGSLCGVIHDPQHDRRDLYLGLRERLEALTETEPTPDPAPQLKRINERLVDLQQELRGAFDRLHRSAGPLGSFHDLVGRWLDLVSSTNASLARADAVTPAELDRHRTDAEEILRRAKAARWWENPFRARLGISVGDWLAQEPGAAEAALSAADPLAAEADRLYDSSGPAFSSTADWEAQAAARDNLAATLEKLRHPAAVRAFSTGIDDAEQNRAATLSREAARLDTPLDRELVLQLGDALPTLAETNGRIAAITTWQGAGGGLAGWLAFAEKKAASAALAPLGLPREPEAAARALEFYRSLRARWLWHGWRAEKTDQREGALASDDDLRAWRDDVSTLNRIHALLTQPELVDLSERVHETLRELASVPALVNALRRSAERARALERLARHLRATGLFEPRALEEDVARWARGESAQSLVAKWRAAAPTLDEAVRLSERLRAAPAALGDSVAEAAAQGLDWSETERALQAGMHAAEIRHRLRTDEALARIDTDRIEAAFAELAERTTERQVLVRRHIQHHWEQRMRSRLVAPNGQRLTSEATTLRTRLLVRGKRALKLRPMIAAGAGLAGGDPLFDLCPVWMASPATVAQIFPREPLFDVVVFDEASQCRLEEALPVLLRGRRVVVAGDPRQLPPTRFFETALTESDATAPETAEEVFAQQQSETEDLLAAALNLDVQQSYLDVHYRSRHEALIGFSNEAFYGGRLQPVPGHPRHQGRVVPIRLVRVDGVYGERGNPAEARAAADLVAELLAQPEPPSIGIACFNLPQRDLILDALDAKVAEDEAFAARLEAARQRRGRDSFEGLFVKNLENVQGDERDQMIISTTFGPDKSGRFRRNFGALSQQGGDRRLNVLVTRARDAVHVLTSIPREEYLAAEADGATARTGRHQLYGYLRYAEALAQRLQHWQAQREAPTHSGRAECVVLPSRYPSTVAPALARRLLEQRGIGSTVHWGNDGFCVDVALADPALPGGVSVGLLTDFNRYRRSADPIAWELFRTEMLRRQGWTLHRLWTPSLFRAWKQQLDVVAEEHQSQLQKPERDDAAGR